MKNSIIISTALILTGCVSVPVERHFPDVPANLLDTSKECANLKTIDDKEVVFSSLMKTVSNNYTQYYTCANYLHDWQKWYNDQKTNFEKVNK